MRNSLKGANNFTDFFEKKDVNWIWRKALTEDSRRGLYHIDEKPWLREKNHFHSTLSFVVQTR